MLAGRVATVAAVRVSSALVFVLDTAKDAFDIILQVGAGTGLLYLVRWFWWRVNAWCGALVQGEFPVWPDRLRSSRSWRCYVVSALVLTRVVNTLWTAQPEHERETVGQRGLRRFSQKGARGRNPER